MTSTEQMRECLEHYRREAKSAEREYDSQANAVQRMASENIDLLGGHATGQVADIAVQCRKACEGLYTSYQTIIQMIDETCRPLLDEETDTVVIGEIADFIEWLNDESEIENNFSASFNSTSLGEVASIRYVPSMENKMIQKFWEQKYSQRPDKAEAEKRRRMQIEQEKAEQKQRKKQEYEDKMKVYEAEFAVWQSEFQEVETKRREWVEQCLERESDKHKAKANKEYQIMKKRLEGDLRLAEARKVMLESEKNLPYLIKSVAQRLQEEFAQAEADLVSYREQLEKLNGEYQRQQSSLETEKNSLREELETQAEKAFPFRAKPKKPFNPGGGNGGENAAYKEAIYDFICEHGSCTISDLQENCEDIKGLTNQRISALVRQLMDEKVLVRKEIERKAYYSIG